MAESNPVDYAMISRRIWKNWPKRPSANSIAWQPFPNEEAVLAE
jgi:hypothetical protein